MIWRIINGSQFQKLWRISIHKNKIYLETKFSTNRGIFVFWRPYGAACLTPCKYPFPLKYFHFWIFNNLFWFYIGGHFEMAAILKILKIKSTILSDDLFLCQVSKESAVRSEFNNFSPWLPWQWLPFWLFSTPQELSHTTVDIPTKLHEVWWKESNNFLNPLFFVSMATTVKFVQPIPIFLAYLVSLDVDVVPIKFHQFLFGE